MDILAEHAARKAAKLELHSSSNRLQLSVTLVCSTRVDFMFKVNFLMLFANVMGKADTIRAFVNLSVVRRIREDTNIAGLDWCDFIHRCLAISHEPNTVSGFYSGPLCFLITCYKELDYKEHEYSTVLEIEDEAFGKLDIYGEWSENETVEAEGFCENSSVLPHTDKKYKGFFKETFLLEETKGQEASVKTKPAAVKAKDLAEMPKPVENVKELTEKRKEPAEKAQEAPQNVKPKPAAVKTNETAEKPMPAENVKELAEKLKEPAGDDYQVVHAATVMKAEDREEFEVRKKDFEPSFSEDEKPLKKKTKGKGKGPRLPIGGISDDEFVQLWLSQFAPKKKKRIFATDIAEKLVRSTRVDFMFKVNFLMLFANVMGKAYTMRAFVNLSVVRRIREDTNIARLDWCDFIHRCLAISHELNTVSGFYNGPLCFLI
nr:ubiquitin-specific protease 13 [Tanacetum cinerariifolium]